MRKEVKRECGDRPQATNARTDISARLILSYQLSAQGSDERVQILAQPCLDLSNLSNLLNLSFLICKTDTCVKKF